jgi:adenylate cyclase
MFTDIEGYTATMQQSEQKAIGQRERHRQVLRQAHEQFRGKVIQYYGDGTLSIFQSAVTAVQCALAMQLQFCQQPEVPVRIGLHIGDIIFDEDQVLDEGASFLNHLSYSHLLFYG